MNTENATNTNEAIIASAFAGLNPADFKTSEEYDVAVAMKARKIQATINNENSLANRLLNACVLKAKVTKVELEDTSKRYKIYFIADNNEDGSEEMIRTDRTDGRIFMTDEYINNLINHQVLIYKTNEKSENSKIMGAGYRIAPYVKVID